MMSGLHTEAACDGSTEPAFEASDERAEPAGAAFFLGGISGLYVTVCGCGFGALKVFECVPASSLGEMFHSFVHPTRLRPSPRCNPRALLKVRVGTSRSI